jgi:hypothetical protein
VLVTEDMLGLFERTPRFVKRFDDLAAGSARRRPPMPPRCAAAPSRPRSRSTAPQVKSLSPAELYREAAGAKIGRANLPFIFDPVCHRAVWWGRGGPGSCIGDFLGDQAWDNESFYREVDEELRKEQLTGTWKRYGKLDHRRRRAAARRHRRLSSTGRTRSRSRPASAASS